MVTQLLLLSLSQRLALCQAAALAEVNKIRTDKKVSTPEMILDMPSSVTEELEVQLENHPS